MIDEKTLSLIAKLTGLPVDRVKVAFELEAEQKDFQLVSVQEVMEKTGWSYSTLRRRCAEYEIELKVLPGWKNKKGLNLSHLITRSGIDLVP